MPRRCANGISSGRPPNEQARRNRRTADRCSGAAPACREPAAQPEGQGASCREGLLHGCDLGFSTALLTLVLDQARSSTLFVYDLPVKEPVEFAPFIDLIVVWNRGISYGLFQQDTELGRWVLIVVSILAAVGLSRLDPPDTEPASGGLARPDRRRGRRQRHRPAGLRRRVRLHPVPRRLLVLVRLQRGRRGHRCGGGRFPL